MTSSAPTGEERAETLEQQVASCIGNGLITRESPLSIAHHAVALCRELIARDIEAERDRVDVPAGARSVGLNAAARIARGGVS